MPTYDVLLESARADLYALLGFTEETERYCAKNGRTRHAAMWQQRSDKIRGAISNVNGIPGIGAVLAETVRTTGGDEQTQPEQSAGTVELADGTELAVRLGDPIVFDPTGRDLIRCAVVGIVIDCDEEAQEPGEQPAPIVRVNTDDDATGSEIVVVRRAFAVLTVSEGA